MGGTKLKIAFLNFYGGAVARGVETYVHELSNRLLKMGYDVSVYQMGDPLPGAIYKTKLVKIPLDWEKEGSDTPFVNYYSLKVKEFTQKALRQMDKDTDIVIPTSGDWQPILCKFWALLHGKKMVIPGQSGQGADDKIKLLTCPNSFVALTSYQGKWAKRFNPFVRVDVIPNGVDQDKFSSQGKPYNLNLPKPIIMTAAALVSWKRIDLILKAVAKLKKGSLLVVGKEEKKDPTREKLTALAEKLLPGRFEIMFFPHAMMPQVYKAVDLFTYSTVPWESFGIVMLEAMATGLAVVAGDDPIRREIVGSAGLFVDPTNTDEYAEALENALSKDWGELPRKQAEKFSWDRITNQYEDLFEKL